MATTPGVYLTWYQGTTALIGKVNSVFQDNEAIQGISFPGNQTMAISFTMASSARDLQLLYSFINVRLYLTGDSAQIATVQGLWPTQGGGLFISYDGGRTFTPFTTTYGYQEDPTTWILLPATAIGLNGTDGVLGPLDSANLVLQYVIPSQATQYQIYDIALTADFDVI